MTTLSLPVLDPMTSSGTLVTADGRALPLRSTRLRVRAAGGLAQVQLVQTFGNPFAEPLHVTYQLPLPADAAVGGFAFRLGAQVVRGEIERRAAARERFEQALATGRTAALLEQDRSALFTQELGNLPPGAEVEATIDIDQPLQWGDGGWQWRFPTTVAPRYLGAAGRVEDAARQQVAVVDPAAAPLPPRCELELWIADALAGSAVPQSPSHALHCDVGAGGLRVAFAAAAGLVAMDRDVVVQWPVATLRPGVNLSVARPAAGALAGQGFGLLTLVPPAAAGAIVALPRDLIVLLDISGSMAGVPLAQAQQVTCELIRSLGDADRLELLAFSSSASAWTSEPQPANAANRAAAEHWVRGLVAGGGTEMHGAILRALGALRAGAQRQVVLVTDGLIGFESEIVGAIGRDLPAGASVHVVGVGSAPNRTLTRGASRAGRGLELLVGLDESAAPAAQRLLARTAAPLVQGLQLSGTALLACAPRVLPDLFAGAPMRASVQLRPEGGSLCIRGVGAAGEFVHDLVVPPLADGGDAAIVRAFGREAVEDLEAELAATGNAAAIESRIEQLGLAHRIATRRTSWVAIGDEAVVDPRAAGRRVVVPQTLPYGMAVQQLGLRPCSSAPSMPMGGADGAMLSVAEPTLRAAPARSRLVMREPGPSFEAADREEAAEAAAPPKAQGGSWWKRLFGGGGSGGAVLATLRVRDANAWGFEITGLAAWSLPERVVVVFADGREVEFVVEVARTTVAGAVAAGTFVRLALRAAAVAIPDAARPVRLRLPQGTAVIEVPVA